ncbi:glycosyltransferase family protein [Lignipirellula cremea]|uniref:GNT-I family protein n=1 Tax=Lignipirellula cremea TaxID=2528010 RepID=A0A518DUP8_9BACT|nr:glycosyltransferase family 2 protein [Lignipirellula cremea]QDU95559.1 hypothetical protein Pla8534_33740 [Lignipirellula cremea]
MAINAPVAFFIFNRPEVTQRVFNAIAQARPRTLMIVADGPRIDVEGEEAAVAATRAIIDQVNWPCEVLKNYSGDNLGCKIRVSSGLEWVFQQTEEAIFLEDDCLPAPGFFPFCQELLERYRHDSRVVSITGNNFQDGISRTSASYYFSKYFHCWGWAGWRRTWEAFDINLPSWPAFLEEGGLANVADSPAEEQCWRRIFNAQHRGETNSWAYAWLFSCMTQGLTATSDQNLVSNIGFEPNATHTTRESLLANLPTPSFGELIHPTEVLRHKAADLHTFESVFRRPPLLKKWKNSVRKRWRRLTKPAA